MSSRTFECPGCGIAVTVRTDLKTLDEVTHCSRCSPSKKVKARTKKTKGKGKNK